MIRRLMVAWRKQAIALVESKSFAFLCSGAMSARPRNVFCHRQKGIEVAEASVLTTVLYRH